jgi:hypothetical protein
VPEILGEESLITLSEVFAECCTLQTLLGVHPVGKARFADCLPSCTRQSFCQVSNRGTRENKVSNGQPTKTVMPRGQQGLPSAFWAALSKQYKHEQKEYTRHPRRLVPLHPLSPHSQAAGGRCRSLPRRELLGTKRCESWSPAAWESSALRGS